MVIDDDGRDHLNEFFDDVDKLTGMDIDVNLDLSIML